MWKNNKRKTKRFITDYAFNPEKGLYIPIFSEYENVDKALTAMTTMENKIAAMELRAKAEKINKRYDTVIIPARNTKEEKAVDNLMRNSPGYWPVKVNKSWSIYPDVYGLIKTGETKIICGYVSIPTNNILHPNNTPSVEKREKLVEDLIVFGGITFQGKIKKVWYIGFDLGHGYSNRRLKADPLLFAQTECNQLAEQVIKFNIIKERIRFIDF